MDAFLARVAVPATATVELMSERRVGKPELTARMVLLPLKSDLGDVTRVLGCLVTKGETGRTPRRFAAQSLKLRHIGALVRDSQREEEEPVAQPLAHLAEDRAEFTPRRPAGAEGKPGHLRLVKTDE